ncbi:MAG: Hsp20/alpha crystallin family protein [Deferrisomatales bacterium]
MALIPWEPRRRGLEPFRGLREEVDRIFDEFFRGWGGPPWAGRGVAPWSAGFYPSVDLKESENELVLTAEVPGLSKEELDVTIAEDSVTLRGERKEEKEREGESYHYREAAYGAFERVIPLPVEVKAEKAQAKLRNGVLTLTLPKAEPSKRKQIKVEVD